MVTWWWLRHGPTHRRDIYGWTDVPADLSDHARLDRIAEFLPDDAPVISSDLGRAIATADAIQRHRPRLPHQTGLREIHFGEWEARMYDDIEAEDPQRARHYWDNPGDAAPPGGESWNALTARVNRTVDHHADSARHIIAVAHFGTILSQVQRARGCSAEAVMAQSLDTLSITRLHWDGETWSADLVNHHP